MAYDFTRDALYRAERRPAFRGHSEIGRLQPSETGFSPVNAWWLASASHLAYSEPDELRATLARVGLEPTAVFDRGDSSGYLAERSELAILAFRGTEPDRVRDLLTDADLLPEELLPGVRAHGGFLDALDQIWPEVQPQLERLEAAGRPVWYTGHSLGGALATLAAARRPPAALCTYGAPRVGESTLAVHLADTATQRFVNCTDIVPRLPPRWLDFEHLGEQRLLTHDGRLVSEPSRLTALRVRAAGQLAYRLSLDWLRPDRVILRSFADHSIVNYVESLRRLALSV